MATTAGLITVVSTGSTTAALTTAPATGGTAPYTYQWHRSLLTGFTPVSGTAITGATGLSLSDSGLIPSSTWYYKVVATDAGAVSGTSAQAVVATLIASQSPNQFQQSSMNGKVDMVNMGDVVSCQVDSTQSGPILPGQAVKMIQSAGGIPKIVACAASSDLCFGFVTYDIKSAGFNAGDKCEVATSDAMITVYATTAIPRGSQVTLDLSAPCSVGVKVTSSGAAIVGWAYDQAIAGQLFRIKLTCPSFTVA